MKRIINGKTYNTATATAIENYDNGLGRRDFSNIDEFLYVTKKGNFFLAGEGGAMTKYSKPCGNMTGGGSDIIPLSKTEALHWMERYGEPEDIERYFSEMIEDA